MNAHVNDIELKRTYDYAGTRGEGRAERRQQEHGETVERRHQAREQRQEHTATVSPKRDTNEERKALEQYLGDVKDRLVKNNVELKFTFHDDTGDLQVELINADNEKVVRKIPPDELIKLSSSLKEMAGAFLDRSV